MQKNTQALYDANGNIIIQSYRQTRVPSANEFIQDNQTIEHALQNKSIRPIKKQFKKPLIRKPSFLASIPLYFRQITINSIHTLQNVLCCIKEEIIQQYTSGVHECKYGIQKFCKNTKTFLLQPVWIIHPKKQSKQYSRTTLFLLDTLRFGFTFGVIFLVLFGALNYQGFWQNIQEYLHPIEYAQRIEKQTSTFKSTLGSQLALQDSAKAHQNAAYYLSPVGPPDNRLIIPKLDLNIPLVHPNFQSFLEENWEKVEQDIQTALQEGVVHYPGTALPGDAGNFFVTGHSSYYPWAPGKYKTIFARLHNLEPGDEYYVYYGGDQFKYIVRSKKEVQPSDVSVLDQPLHQRISTLMTCTPVGTTLKRLVVVADEVDPLTNEILQVGEQQKKKDIPDLQLQMLPI